jgi:hypothetical protein
VKSSEVYGILRDEVGPWAKAQGFKRGRNVLSWYRPYDSAHVVFWLQISQDGWDNHAGSKFVVEFQLSESSEAFAGDASHRKRLAKLLDDGGLKELWEIQNEVILSLRKPPSNHPFLHSASLRDWYLRKFEPVPERYSQADDVWLRYYSEDDVHRWGQFLLRCLPRCISEMQDWATRIGESDD